MILKIKDKKYKNIVKDIIRNNNIKKMANIRHHGITRLEHSIKVSYKAYKIAYKLKWDYVSVARAGLMHDFYLDGNERSRKEICIDTFTHPVKVIKTVKDNFNINTLEEDIIISHMFPIYKRIPRYKESVLVNLVDKVIGLHEFLFSFKYLLKYKVNYSYLIILVMLGIK